ncbi:hypothetical protein KR49_09355 [Synechococcus sp. KORDI-49]|nr:hypothetical protein KR49_09355 [Synechococcus sp. KORDI-49]
MAWGLVLKNWLILKNPHLLQVGEKMKLDQ